MTAQVKNPDSLIVGLWGVRYQVKDVSRSVAFYTLQLGFDLDLEHLPAFAQVSVGNLKLILSGPGAWGRGLSRELGLRSPVGGTASFSKSPIFRLGFQC